MMWHDNETKIDYINFQLVAEASSQLIRDAAGEPISIGVSGGWGTGKSSLVRMIEAQLSASDDANNKFVMVAFNAWLYQGFDDARSSLLQAVGDALLHEAETRASFVDKAKALAGRINLLKATRLGAEAVATIVTGVPVGAIGEAVNSLITSVRESDLAGAGKAVSSGAGKAGAATQGLIKDKIKVSLPQEIQGFRNALEELLDKLKITLVVFVDDLDRCLPATTIATLEAMRLLLFLKRSAFVIAADDVFIRGAVKVHFQGTEISDSLATSYFDKLVQISLRVPRLGINEVKGYAALLFIDRAIRTGGLDAAVMLSARTAVMERLKSSWKGESVDRKFLEGLVPTAQQDVRVLMGLADRLAPLLVTSTAIASNPRLIKRFLNTVFLRMTLAKAQGISVDIPTLAKWHILERFNEILADQLAGTVSSANEGRASQLMEAEQACVKGSALPSPFTDDKHVKEWLALEPALGDTDLRPILHLSRDTTVRDFGVDDLGAAGRELFEALVTVKSTGGFIKESVKGAGEAQADIAMVRAWQKRLPRRTWKSADDLAPLVAVCDVFPNLGTRACDLLSEASPSQLAPALIPPLYGRPWAQPALTRWMDSPDTPENVKRAIKQAKGKA